MKPAEFAYQRPTDLAQALTTYAATPDAKILAGGQSLVPLLSMRLATVAALIDINGIEELSRITVTGDGVRFGATVRHSDLLENAEVAASHPLIPAALRHVAHPTIRNRGTTVGSIVHADASGEMPAVFALLEGRLTAQSVRGRREIAPAELFVGALETSLEADEIATEVFLPALPPGHGVSFTEVARRHGDYALCGVAAIVGVDPDGALTSVRAGYVSVSDVPVVADLTDAFTGGRINQANLHAAGEAALSYVEPEDDIHASARYRAQLVRTLTGRAIGAAHSDALERGAREAPET